MKKTTYIHKDKINILIDNHYEQLFKRDSNLHYLASVPKNETNPNIEEYCIENGIVNKNGLSISKIPLIQDKDGGYSIPKPYLDKIYSSEIYTKKNYNSNFNKNNTISKEIEVEQFKLQIFCKKIRPLCAGINIGHEYSSESSGTLGGIIELVGHSRPYIISNFHVLSGNVFVHNKLITQPSRNVSRGFKASNIIAKLKYGHFGGLLDVGLAEILPSINQHPGSFLNTNSPTGIQEPKDGEIVTKIGISSNLTKGKIRSTNMYVRFRTSPTSLELKIFKKQILLKKMSVDGDSGSILTNSDNKAVGIIFGGDNKTYSVANNINHVFHNKKTNLYDNLPPLKFKKFI